MIPPRTDGNLFFQAFLSNEDLGDSLDSVEALIKKHEDFEKSLAAQEEKIKVKTLKHFSKQVNPSITCTSPMHIELNSVGVKSLRLPAES